jgi:hypothetical protein
MFFKREGKYIYRGEGERRKKKKKKKKSEACRPGGMVR